MATGHGDHAGHGGHGHHGGGHGGHGDHAAVFRDRFWLSLALTVPVILYSEMVQEWLRFTPPQFPGSEWVAPVLGTIVFLYGGGPFLQGGLAEARVIDRLDASVLASERDRLTSEIDAIQALINAAQTVP